MQPQFHYSISGDDVFIEEAHMKDQLPHDVHSYGIENSTFVRSDLITHYRTAVNGILARNFMSAMPLALVIQKDNYNDLKPSIEEKLDRVFA